MQKVKGVCKECGGDGLRQQVGLERGVPKCTHCDGSGMEPVPKGPSGADELQILILQWINSQKTYVSSVYSDGGTAHAAQDRSPHPSGGT